MRTVLRRPKEKKNEGNERFLVEDYFLLLIGLVRVDESCNLLVKYYASDYR